jgi:ketosteroid isomerase-like protein
VTNRLPAVISRYFDADRVRDVDAIVSCFTDDAAVSDEGRTWQGHDKIRAWRTGTAAKFQYTIEVLDTTAAEAPSTASERHDVHTHMEGNFPGGQVDLTFRFTLCDGLISTLDIG